MISWPHILEIASISLGIGFLVEGLWGPGVGFLVFGLLSAYSKRDIFIQVKPETAPVPADTAKPKPPKNIVIREGEL